MGIDDIFRQFETWRKLTDMNRLFRKFEDQRRLMEPQIGEIAKHMEERRHLLEPTTSETARKIEEQRSMMALPLSELSKHLEEQRRLLQPTVSWIADQIEQQRRLLEPAVGELARSLSRQRQLIEPLSVQFAATKELLRNYSEWASRLETEASEIAINRSQLQEVLQASAVPTLGFIASHFDHTVRDLREFEDFRRTFAAEILTRLDRINVADDDSDIEEAVDELAQFVRQKAEELPRRRLTLDGLIQIVQTLLLFAWAQLSSIKS